MRHYAPWIAALTRDWAPPPITQVSSYAADVTVHLWNMAEREPLANVESALLTGEAVFDI